MGGQWESTAKEVAKFSFLLVHVLFNGDHRMHVHVPKHSFHSVRDTFYILTVPAGDNALLKCPCSWMSLPGL